MPLTREAAVQVAIATNLNFLLLEQIKEMNRAIVVNGAKLDLNDPDNRKLIQVLSKGLVVSKGLIDTVMNHYDTQMGEIDTPEFMEWIKPILENDLVLLDLEKELNLTSAERLMQILKQVGQHAP